VIGSSPNRFLTGGIARIGRGEEYWVQDGEEPDAYIKKFYQFSGHPLLTDIKVELPVSFGAYDVSSPSGILLAERPVVVCGKYRGTVPKSISFTGYQADGVQWIGVAPTSSTFSAFKGFEPRVLKYLWVGSAIDEARYLMEGEKQKAALIKLGLSYGVLTEFTSFLAVDQHVRYDVDNTTLFTVSQPLPLPYGVSNKATGDFWEGDPAGSNQHYPPPPPGSFPVGLVSGRGGFRLFGSATSVKFSMFSLLMVFFFRLVIQ